MSCSPKSISSAIFRYLPLSSDPSHDEGLFLAVDGLCLWFVLASTLSSELVECRATDTKVIHCRASEGRLVPIYLIIEGVGLGRVIH